MHWVEVVASAPVAAAMSSSSSKVFSSAMVSFVLVVLWAQKWE
jgi:hypothetical protein